MNKKGIFFYIKSYKFNSVFIKNFFLVILLFMIPFLLFSMFYYYNTKNMMESEIRLENELLAENVKTASDTVFKQADYVTSYVTNMNNVEMFMLNDWFNNLESDKSLSLRDIVNTVPLIYELIDSIYIYSEVNGIVITSSGFSKIADFQDNNWFSVYERIEKTAIIPRLKNNIFPQYISFIRPVFINGLKKGAVVVNINANKSLSSFSTDKYGSMRNIFAVDGNKTVIAAAEREYFGMKTSDIPLFKNLSLDTLSLNSDTSNYIISTAKSEYYGIIYVNFTHTDIYSGKMGYIVFGTLILILGLIIISVIAAFIIAVNSFKPMREMIAVLDEPDKFSDLEPRSGNLNEIKYIINRMIETIHHTKESEAELAGRLVQLDKSHFAMLQSQINPHFLYNTLETINWMASDLMNDYENPVSLALSNLGELFRNNTRYSEYFSKLSDEIRGAKLYIDILRLRYGDMFDVEWDIDDEEMSVIKITLQPFIENAVYHGIKPAGGGTIKISIRADNDNTVIIVSDNGVGMAEEQLEKFVSTLSLDFKDSDRHIGVYNVYRRYKIVFGEQCSINVKSKYGKGTEVRLVFPRIEL